MTGRWEQYRAVRREMLRDEIELWLVTTGEWNSTRGPMHPDEFHARQGKPGSRPAQEMRWLEMSLDPDVQRTNAFLHRAFAVDLQRHDPDAHAAVWDAYLGPFADPSLPAFWLRRDLPAREIPRPPIPEKRRNGVVVEPQRKRPPIYAPSDHARYHAVELGIQFAVKLAEREKRVLVVADPDGAEDFVSRKRRQRMVARRVFFQELHEGAKPGEAIRAAVKESGASRRAVYYWTRQTRNRGKERPERKPEPEAEV